MEVLFLWLLCAFAAAAIATAKGRSTGGWFVAGCIFGLLAVIIVAILSSKAAPTDLPRDHADTEDMHVRCPECRELVRADARKCKHCGAALIPATAAEPRVGELALPADSLRLVKVPRAKRAE